MQEKSHNEIVAHTSSQQEVALRHELEYLQTLIDSLQARWRTAHNALLNTARNSDFSKRESADLKDRSRIVKQYDDASAEISSVRARMIQIQKILEKK